MFPLSFRWESKVRKTSSQSIWRSSGKGFKRRKLCMALLLEEIYVRGIYCICNSHLHHTVLKVNRSATARKSSFFQRPNLCHLHHHFPYLTLLRHFYKSYNVVLHSAWNKYKMKGTQGFCSKILNKAVNISFVAEWMEHYTHGDFAELEKHWFLRCNCETNTSTNPTWCNFKTKLVEFDLWTAPGRFPFSFNAKFLTWSSLATEYDTGPLIAK